MEFHPIITDIPELEITVQAVFDGSIEDHIERLHSESL
jgi:hypothetical protein